MSDFTLTKIKSKKLEVMLKLMRKMNDFLSIKLTNNNLNENELRNQLRDRKKLKINRESK